MRQTTPSRGSMRGASVYRTRECDHCSARMKTAEIIAPVHLGQAEGRLLDIYRSMDAYQRKALWAILKLLPHTKSINARATGKKGK